MFIFTLSFLGWILSAYALYVEYKTSDLNENDNNFTALCDIPQLGASCSAVLNLPQSHLLRYFNLVQDDDSVFNVPNAGLGILYYTYMMVYLITRLTTPSSSTPIAFTDYLTLVVSTLALSVSLYLAYELTKLGDLCLLCWTTHLINAILFVRMYQRAIVGHPTPRAQKLKQG